MSALASDTIASSFVILKGGGTVALEALQLAWALEDRGATFAVEGDGLVIESLRGVLTEDDCAAIRRWRLQLKTIATYRAPEVVE